MLNKMSLIASTLGLTIAGAGVDVNTQTPLHITQTELAAAYSFDTREACDKKIEAIYKFSPKVRGKLYCTK